MDEIHIKQLEVFAHHGVFPEENRLGQKFVISADLRTDLRPAGLTDDLMLSMDYGAVCAEIQTFLTQNTFQLLETAAEMLCEHLFMKLPLLDSIRLEIEKPWAPIGLPLKTASVSIERGWHMVYLSIGSNIGDKKKYLDDAVAALQDKKQIKEVIVSDYLITEPYGGVEQDDFLNAAIGLKTLLTPHELLDFLHQIEQNAHRQRLVHWGPRTLDLDILFYDDLIFADETLHIPHPEIPKRAFVLKPMSQIAPYFMHPMYRLTIMDLLDKL